MRFSYILLLLTLPICVNSQTPAFVKKWDKRYGGSMEEGISNFIITTDSNLVLCGTSYSGISGDKTEDNYDTSLVSGDFWIVKTDSNAVKIWDKRYGGNNAEIHEQTIQTSDGGYLSGGQSFSGISGDKSQPNWDPTQQSNDYWIIKTDSAGNKQWDKRFGGTSFELIGSILQTTNGGYLISGSSFSGISGDKTQATQGSWDYWVVRTNSTGSKIWDKRFGGPQDDFATCMAKTADGGYVIGGYSKSNPGGDKTQACQGNWDYWLVKIDDQGNKIWDKTYGGNYTDWLFTIIKTSDDGFLLGGQSFSEVSGDKTEPNTDPTPAGSDRWMVKIDAAGNKLWDHTYGGSEIEDVSDVVQTPDKGYFISGQSYSPADGEKTEPNLGIEQTWVVKTDSMGVFEWDKTVFTNGHDESGSALPFSDGCFIVVNFTEADTGGYISEMSRGAGDYWMTKLCKEDPLSVSENPIGFFGLCLYPNPVSDVLYLTSSEKFSAPLSIEIRDISGKLMAVKHLTDQSKKDKTILFITSGFPAGMYFCRIQNQKSIVNLKFIKAD